MDTKSFHLARQPAPEALLKGGASKGEFHESAQSASKALLAGVASTGEIHLKSQCAPEGIVEGVSLRGGYIIVPPKKATCPRRHSDGVRPER